MFEEVLDDFADYYRAQKVAGTPGFEEAAGLEVQRRLRHLNFLLREVAWLQKLMRSTLVFADQELDQHEPERLDERYRLAAAMSEQELAARGFVGIDMGEQVEMLAESFYFHAHRLLKLLQHGPLPGFEALQARGVLLVRNQLVEHFPQRGEPWPQHHSRDLSDDEAGPKLSKASEPVQDLGLYRNAQELRDAIASTLEALPRTPSPPDSGPAFGGARWWAQEQERQIGHRSDDDPSAQTGED